MSRIRAMVRLTAMAAVTLAMLPPLLAAVLLGDRTQRWRSGYARAWSRGLLTILGGRLEIRGTPPDGPFLLVSNHLGYIDIVVLGSLLRCVFVSRGDVAGWPAIGFLARCANTIFVDRSRRADVTRVNDEIGRRLERGVGVVVFPEATSTDGSGVLPFRPGLLEPAVQRGLPVHYATLGYRSRAGDPPAHEALAWWGDMTFGPHVLELAGLRGFTATVSFGTETILETDRRRLATRLHEAVVARFEPLTDAAQTPENAWTASPN